MRNLLLLFRKTKIFCIYCYVNYGFAGRNLRKCKNLLQSTADFECSDYDLFMNPL